MPNNIRFDKKVSDAQMKLAIAQVLSLPFAYDEPVIVIDFDINETGIITGKFTEFDRPRVFSFEINDELVTYKPYLPNRNDSDIDINDTEWIEYSEGFLYRLDAPKAASTGKKYKCTKPTSYNCGRSCINVNRSCKVVPKDAISKTRIKKLKALGVDWRAAIGRPKKSKKPPVTGGGGGGTSTEVNNTTKPDVTEVTEIKDKETNQQRKERLLQEAKQVRLNLWRLRNDFLIENEKGGNIITSNERPEDKVRRSVKQLEDNIKKLNIEDSIKQNQKGLEELKVLSENTNKYLDKARELIYVKNPTPIKPKLTTTKDDIKQASLEGVELFSKMVDIPKLTKTNVKITGTPGGEPRSFFKDGNNTLYMGRPDKAVVIHELGHWVEMNIPGVAKEVKEFYNKRTEGEKPRRLKDVVPNANFRNDEITRVDKWLNPYMGKIYPTGSEVLSMGLEMMHRNPAYLADKDPEMFDFIYSVVRRGKE